MINNRDFLVSWKHPKNEEDDDEDYDDMGEYVDVHEVLDRALEYLQPPVSESTRLPITPEARTALMDLVNAIPALLNVVEAWESW